MSARYSSLSPLTFLALLLLAPSLHATDERILSTVELFGQETSSWCWAASVKMTVPEMYTEPQCSVVQRTTMYSEPTDCCGAAGPCAGQGGQARYCYSSLSYLSSYYTGAIPFDDKSGGTPDQGIRDQIDLDQSFVTGWKWIGCSECYHEFVVYGYTAAISKVIPAVVWIHDPMPVGSGDTWALTYDQYSISRREITRIDPFDATDKDTIRAHQNAYSVIDIRPS